MLVESVRPVTIGGVMYGAGKQFLLGQADAETREKAGEIRIVAAATVKPREQGGR